MENVQSNKAAIANDGKGLNTELIAQLQKQGEQHADMQQGSDGAAEKKSRPPLPRSKEQLLERVREKQKEKEATTALHISPFSNMHPMERRILRRIVENNNNDQGRAEFARQNYILTNDNDLNVRFFVYLFRNHQHTLSDEEKSMYLFGSKKRLTDEERMLQAPQLDPYLAHLSLFSVFSSAFATMILARVFRPSLPQRKLPLAAAGVGLAAFLAASGAAQAYQGYEKEVAALGKKHRILDTDQQKWKDFKERDKPLEYEMEIK